MHFISRLTRAAAPLKLTLIVGLVLLDSLSNAEAQPKACGSDIRTIEVNRTTLHYFECGKGEPLVFVHGGVGSLRTFRGQVEAFAANFRVIAYSRRYYPPNIPARAGDGNPLSIHLADLVALVTALKATPAHFVGNSYGAYIALALAVDQPKLVRSLVLAEPPILPLLSSTAVGEAMRESWHRRVLAPAAKALESGDVEEALRRFLDAIGGTGSFDRIPQATRTEMVEKQGSTLRLDLPTDMSGLMPVLACERLRELRHPTLLVTGELTHPVFLLITTELERCLENEAVHMVPEATHAPHSENPASYNDAVREFLQQSVTRRGKAP